MGCKSQIRTTNPFLRLIDSIQLASTQKRCVRQYSGRERDYLLKSAAFRRN